MKERIKELRKTFKLSQASFATHLGINSKGTISSYENGTHNIPDRVINHICREFKVDYLWLAEGKGKMFLATKNSIDDLIIRKNLTH